MGLFGFGKKKEDEKKVPTCCCGSGAKTEETCCCGEIGSGIASIKVLGARSEEHTSELQSQR